MSCSCERARYLESQLVDARAERDALRAELAQARAAIDEDMADAFRRGWEAATKESRHGL